MFDQVAGILREFIADPEAEITADSALVEDLGLSSLELINMIAEFENRFDIEIPDRVIPTMHTVGDVVAYLEKNAG